MSSEAVLEELVEADIATLTDEHVMQLTASFAATMEEPSMLDDGNNESGPLQEVLPDDHLRDVLRSALETEGIETAPAVIATRTELTDLELLDAVLLVLEMRRPEPPTEGAPDSFVPVHGDLLPIYAALNPRSIAYVWRHECPPCEEVRSVLDDLLPDPRGDIGLFSIYGPDYPRALDEAYNVIGGPTLLFLHGDRVDARLVGMTSRPAIESEVETCLEESTHT